jgi:UDP-2-acetamido-3-amino-2,3-dideoxy-glucuronate N-acetyltransferase
MTHSSELRRTDGKADPSRRRLRMITDDVRLGSDVQVAQPDLVNLYGCEIGDGTRIAAFVEIQRDVVVGRNVRIEAFAYLPSGVTIEDDVYIGPHVCFTNDHFPRAVGSDGKLVQDGDRAITPTVVRRGASVGAGSTVLCGVSIGERAMIGAGSVVTHDVHPNGIARGNPARVAGTMRELSPHLLSVRPENHEADP